MQKQANSKPILIYFKTRGNAQVIRSILYQVGTQFDEIWIPYKGNLDQQIVQKYQIEMKNLPYFVHGELVMYGIFPIMKYICMRFNRPDLLGVNVVDSILLTQMMVKETHERNEFLHLYFKGLRDIKQKNLGDNGINQLTKMMIQRSEKSKFMELIRPMYIQSQGFIFGKLTIIDFVFYQKCFYCSNTVMSKQPKTEIYLSYCKFFQNTTFYKKYSQKLEIYKVFMPDLDELLNQMLVKTWIGHPKYISKD